MTLEAAVANGTASPSDLVELDRQPARVGTEMADRFVRFAKKLATYREEPIVFYAQWPQAFRLVETMQRLGIAGGGWHPSPSSSAVVVPKACRFPMTTVSRSSRTSLLAGSIAATG